MRTARALVFVAIVTMLTTVAGAQILAPQPPPLPIPPPDEPAILISSEFVQDDGGVKVVQNVTIDVAGVSIAGARGRMRGNSQITLENATIRISPDVATHVRSMTIFRGDQFGPPPGR